MNDFIGIAGDSVDFAEIVHVVGGFVDLFLELALGTGVKVFVLFD